MASLICLGGLLGALWWALFALKPYDISPAQLAERYAHQPAPVRAGGLQFGTLEPVTVGSTPGHAATLRFESFDGAVALGRIVYPEHPAGAAAAGRRLPVLLALHGLGRTQWRWWQADFKGRPTIENTHRLAELALQQGHAVVALDARGHGDRKDPERPLLSRELLMNLHVWGEREPYERLIVETVKDYRVLLDGIEQQPQLDAGRIRAAGYSLGAQMALLLAGTDPRVRAVAAMVPPAVGDTVAAVSPRSVAGRLAPVTVWLLTADDDEYAAARDNASLFEALPGPDKRHLRFSGGHVLPAAYVDQLRPWFEWVPPVRAVAAPSLRAR